MFLSLILLKELTLLCRIQTTYIESNHDEAWKYDFYFAEPVPARYVQFVAEEVDDSKCMFGLTLTGCTLGMEAISLNKFAF